MSRRERGYESHRLKPLIWWAGFIIGNMCIMCVELKQPNPWWGSGVCSLDWPSLSLSLTHTHKTGLTDVRTLLNPFHWSQYFTLWDFYNKVRIIWIGQCSCARYVLIDAAVTSRSQTVINTSLFVAIINKYYIHISVWTCIYSQEQYVGIFWSPLIFCVCVCCAYVCSMCVRVITSLCHSEGGQPCPYISGNAS